MTEHTGNRFAWLDYARLLAAMAVLVFHYFYYGPTVGRSPVRFEGLESFALHGYLGVDLFFIISGFVILNSALTATPGRFALGRAMRLYPAFLLCMTATAVAKNMWGGEGYEIGWLDWFVNLTMIPAWVGKLVSTDIRIVDGVYWTLALELTFYAAVWLILLFRQMHRFELILACWVGGMVAVRVFELKGIPLFSNYYFAYFASGAALSLIYRSGFKPVPTACLAITVLLTLSSAASAPKDDASPVIVALIVLSFYAAFLVFRKVRFSPLLEKHSASWGALTYPLYLLHAHLGYVVFRNFATDTNKWLVAGLTIAGMIAASWAVSRYESWIRRQIKKYLLTRRSLPVGSSQAIAQAER